jgi:curved DNA-binding protein CbpA
MLDRDAYEVLQVHPNAHHLVIQAAYRVLAALYHPDRDDSAASTHRMAELNVAYAKVRTVERRTLYDSERERRPQPAPAVVTPYRPVSPRPAAAVGGGVLDFGRYNGWAIRELAREDPDYLRWLSRHSSGIRFRTEIESVLREATTPQASERVLGKKKR